MQENAELMTPAELRAVLKSELTSVFWPSLGMGVVMGAFLGVYGLPQQGVPSGASTGVAAGLLAAAALAVLGWCYREGARATSNMSRMITGPVWELLLQRVLGMFLNLGVGLVIGPFRFLQTLFRLWQLRGQ